MLSHSQRLKEEWRIRQIMRQGNRVHTSFFVIVRLSSSEPVNKFAFVASKKVGNAIQRNRATRILREAVRASIVSKLPAHDYVIIAKNAILDKHLALVTEEISHAEKKLERKQR